MYDLHVSIQIEIGDNIRVMVYLRTDFDLVQREQIFYGDDRKPFDKQSN